jgi:hypothetical protein
MYWRVLSAKSQLTFWRNMSPPSSCFIFLVNRIINFWKYRDSSEQYMFCAGFEVLAVVVLKSSILWNITPCSPLKVNRYMYAPFLGLKKKASNKTCHRKTRFHVMRGELVKWKQCFKAFCAIKASAELWVTSWQWICSCMELEQWLLSVCWAMKCEIMKRGYEISVNKVAIHFCKNGMWNNYLYKTNLHTHFHLTYLT